MTNRRYFRALLPLSADPITKGHVHLVRKALGLAEEVIVFVGHNDSKRGKYLFDITYRTLMARHVLDHAGLEHVRIVAGDALMVGVYIREACDVVIRGVRNAADRHYEETQMALHNLIHPIQVEYVVADDEMSKVSSTMVKAFTDHSVDTSPYVDIAVKRRLEVAIKEQWLVGVTGSIATGKSWVVDALVSRCKARGIPATAIKVDDIQRQLYVADTPAGERLRNQLVGIFGSDVLIDDGKGVDRKLVMRTLSDPQFPDNKRKLLHELVKPLVLQAIREARNGSHWGDHPYRMGVSPGPAAVHDIQVASRRPPQGLVFIEWAQMAEMDLSHWVNHNVIVVDAKTEIRDIFIEARGLEPEVVSGLKGRQWSAEEKAESIANRAEEDGWGEVLLYENDPNQNMIDELIDSLLEMLPDLRDWPRHRRS